jgi:hypothetical protein
MARPTELTPETQQILCDALSELPIKHACDVAEIGVRTYYDWIKRGDAGEEPYASFRKLARKKRAEFVRNELADIREAGERDWKAKAWYLERVHAKEFQPRSKTETKHSGKLDVPQAVPDSTLTEAAKLLLTLGLASPVHADPVQPTPTDHETGGGAAV